MTFESEKKREERLGKRNLFLGVFIAIILVLSTVGFAVLQGDRSNDEDQEENFSQDGRFQTKVENYAINTKFSPSEINKCENCGSYQKYLNLVVYYVAETKEEIKAISEINFNLNQLIKRGQFACSPESNLSYCEEKHLPTKDCSSNLIIIKESDKNKIEIRENCVYIYGEEENLIKMADEFILNIFGLK